MKNKKAMSTIIMLSSILSLILVAIPASAGEFHTVRGDLYINGAPASEGIQVKIIFETGEETDLTSATGHYAIDFKGYDYETGIFWVFYNGIWRQPTGNPDLDIDPDQKAYVQDLNVTITNNPPNTPSNPSPGNGTTSIGIDDDLSWTGGDPDVGDTVTYDVYFGTVNPPTTKVSTAQSGTSYNPAMVSSTTYYWKIVTLDNHGASTSSQVWSFTTTSGSTPPPPSGPGGPGGTNNPPKADAGGPYEGFIGVELTFDGSKSTDADGTITYSWNFGDGVTGTGQKPKHTYSEAKKYTVTLTVTDDDSATNTNTTDATITEKPNIPPIKPEVTGSHVGTKNVNYSYNAMSTDEDNDTIKYIFAWGDGDTTTTEFIPNGTTTIPQTHKWSAAGVYTINVKANDNKTDSESTDYVVLIDAIFVKDIGYLLGQDGTYDMFYSNETGQETAVQKQTNGTYLINSDSDSDWDWIYDPQTDTLAAYATSEGAPKETGADNTLWYATIGIIIAIILIAIIYLATRKKQKPKTKK